MFLFKQHWLLDASPLLRMQNKFAIVLQMRMNLVVGLLKLSFLGVQKKIKLNIPERGRKIRSRNIQF